MMEMRKRKIKRGKYGRKYRVNREKKWDGMR